MLVTYLDWFFFRVFHFHTILFFAPFRSIRVVTIEIELTMNWNNTCDNCTKTICDESLLFQLECISYDLKLFLFSSLFFSIINLKLSYCVAMYACQLHLFISCSCSFSLSLCIQYICIVSCVVHFVLCTRPFLWFFFSLWYQFQHELWAYRYNHKRENDRMKNGRERKKTRSQMDAFILIVFSQGLSFKSMWFDWCGNSFYVHMINSKINWNAFRFYFCLNSQNPSSNYRITTDTFILH